MELFVTHISEPAKGDGESWVDFVVSVSGADEEQMIDAALSLRELVQLNWNALRNEVE